MVDVRFLWRLLNQEGQNKDVSFREAVLLGGTLDGHVVTPAISRFSRPSQAGVSIRHLQVYKEGADPLTVSAL